jgi:hypothetical protein
MSLFASKKLQIGNELAMGCGRLLEGTRDSLLRLSEYFGFWRIFFLISLRVFGFEYVYGDYEG